MILEKDVRREAVSVNEESCTNLYRERLHFSEEQGSFMCQWRRVYKELSQHLNVLHRVEERPIATMDEDNYPSSLILL